MGNGTVRQGGVRQASQTLGYGRILHCTVGYGRFLYGTARKLNSKELYGKGRCVTTRNQNCKVRFGVEWFCLVLYGNVRYSKACLEI